MQKMDSGGRCPVAPDRPSVQPLLIMKLTVILLLTALLQVQASGWAQTIRLEGKDLPLRTVFSAIEAQTGYVAVYNQRDLAHAKTVTLHVRDMPLVTFLEFTERPAPHIYDPGKNDHIVAEADWRIAGHYHRSCSSFNSHQW